ncbi:MAG: FGGY-family carbohydrate kinase [Pseudomonadota bacterium]
MRHVAVLDLGKTNAKLALVDHATGAEIAVLTRPNTVLPGPPYPHFDTEGLWAFFLDALARMQVQHGIDAISITTHGACAALLQADGTLACPVLDYEHDGPDTLTDAYNALRPGFALTGSARLPMGLNVGAQLFWLLETMPGLRGRVATVVTWPQYWAHRLTGVLASDVTSLGCHTDLWAPAAAGFSGLVDRLGLAGKIAPPRRPGDVLGPVLPGIAMATGLDPTTPVVCGIHDSNASLLPHLLARAGAFSVVSTGTWVVVMAVGGTSPALDPGRDTLINVNALGAPVPSARFMGGREHDLMQTGVAATAQDVTAVLSGGVMLLPSVVQGSGPYPAARHVWTAAATPGQATVALGLYLALMTATCLEMIGAQGPTVVEGPFSQNPQFLAMLATATGRSVEASVSRTGTAAGAALLYPGGALPGALPQILPDAALAGYAAAWRARVAG